MNLGDYYELSQSQIDRFNRYMDLLIDWNKRINLTAIVEKDDIILKHFIDSLTISKYVDNNSKIIDIGTGAGFPGIPLKIYNDSLDVMLLDSLNKRIIFLNEVIKELDLKGVLTIHSRAEDLSKKNEFRECYDIATSRAVSSLNVLVEYMLPFVKVGGKCICMKGSNVEQEIANSKNAIKILGGKIDVIDEFYLPDSDIKRSVIVIKKIKKTDNKYPRNAGIPIKNPL